jgi:hypothetical protein
MMTHMFPKLTIPVLFRHKAAPDFTIAIASAIKLASLPDNAPLTLCQGIDLRSGQA